MNSQIRPLSIVVELTHGLRAGVRACVQRAREVDIASVSSSTAPEAQRALVLTVVGLLTEAIDLCRRTYDMYDDERRDSDDDVEGSVDPTDVNDASDSSSGGREIASIAFVGSISLKSLLGRLTNSAGMVHDDVIDECGRTLRRITRTLAAIDVAFAHEDNSTSELSFRVDLIESIATRRHYGRIRRAIVGYDTPEDVASARLALERVRIHFALLMGSDDYSRVRLADRVQFEQLRFRMHDVLGREHAATSYLIECKRLWQDLVGFAGLIAQVSRREELVENDTRVVVEAHRALVHANAIPPRLRARIDMLAGSDDEVDQLLEHGHWDVSRWRPVLARVHDRLVHESTDQFLRTRASSLASVST